MLKELIDFGGEVSLTANSTLQFLDFGFKLDDKPDLRLSFAEIQAGDTPDLLKLRKVRTDPDTDRRLDSETGEPINSDAVYQVKLRDAIAVLANEWLPLPVLKSHIEARREGPDRFEKGPTVWSRIRVVRLDTPDARGNDHRVILAFDTRFEPRRPNRPYTAPSREDVANKARFELAARMEECAWFLQERWVQGWLKEAFEAGRRAGRGVDYRREDDAAAEFPYWACYVALLEGIDARIDVPIINFLDTVSDNPQVPFDVDLVLDIGNNRTCGVLFEATANNSLGQDNATRLELRDLEMPQFAYSDPFQSRVEFRELKFSVGPWAALSGTSTSFVWPSLMRLGNEARRLNAQSIGSEGVSGLSAPKRYLWDRQPREQQWSFNVSGKPAGTRSAIVGLLTGHLTEAGDLVSRDPAVSPAFRANFSRASLFSLQVMEIVLHAFRQINEPGYRWNRIDRNVPRRLRRIILTVPSATPIVERHEYEQRAQDGLNLVWETMEWDKPERAQFAKPDLKIAYDEASCTQLVYLYAEIMERYQRTSEEYLRLKAPAFVPGEDKAHLRIASIDIGGGTTDLMITTYGADRKQPHTLKMRQNFREGFRNAGDDIVGQVISYHVLAGIAKALRNAGIGNAEACLNRILNPGNVTARERQRRILFVSQVLTPLAYALLGLYERSGEGSPVDGVAFSEAFDAQSMPSAGLLGFFDDAVRTAGGTDFSLARTHFPLVASAMAKTIEGSIGQNLRCLTDVVAAFECDYLLLTGRPSRFPAIRDMVMTAMPVPPHHVVFMHDYMVGQWYPFPVNGNRIGDPKTTVVVGALICALAESGSLDNFSLPRNSFSLPSTAKYVGQMTVSGALIEDHLLFVRDASGKFPEESRPMVYGSPVRLGFRQLSNATWPATPLYRLYVPPSELTDRDQNSMPWTVVLTKPEQPRQEDESFKVGRVSDAEGLDLPQARRKLQLRLHTMMDAEGFWADTGRLDVPNSI